MTENAAEKSPPTEPQGIAGTTEDGRGYVVTPQAMAVEDPPRRTTGDQDSGARSLGSDGPTSVTDLVEQPAKVMRIGTMIRQLLEEVKAAPLDDPSRERLRSILQASIAELKAGLAPELVAELERITQPFASDTTPSDAELRIAHAQLIGWLEGLFQGIQTALFAQQMAARAQLEQMRHALPSAAAGPDQPPGPGPHSGGMYL